MDLVWSWWELRRLKSGLESLAPNMPGIVTHVIKQFIFSQVWSMTKKTKGNNGFFSSVLVVNSLTSCWGYFPSAQAFGTISNLVLYRAQSSWGAGFKPISVFVLVWVFVHNCSLSNSVFCSLTRTRGGERGWGGASVTWSWAEFNHDASCWGRAPSNLCTARYFRTLATWDFTSKSDGLVWIVGPILQCLKLLVLICTLTPVIPCT